MIKFFKANRWTAVGIISGGVAGYLYYHFVGCASGSCAITSNPFASIVYGCLLGGLVFSLFESKKTKTE